jgi:hypothetical protein
MDIAHICNHMHLTTKETFLMLTSLIWVELPNLLGLLFRQESTLQSKFQEIL